jgi:hypothetical protein
MLTVTSTIDIPDEVNVKVKICKFWGTMCTSYLADEDVNFCEMIGTSGDDEYYCAPAGTYTFTEEFELPEASLSNFAVNGVSFRIYVLLNNEFTCHAQFTTVKVQSYSMSYSLLGIAFVVLSAVSMSVVQQRRRKARTTAKVNLQQEEERTVEVVDFRNNNSSRNDGHANHGGMTEMNHYVTL